MSAPLREPLEWVDPDSWAMAAELLVTPPDTHASFETVPLLQVLKALLSLHLPCGGATPQHYPLSSILQLGRQLLQRNWDPQERADLRRAADHLRRELVGDPVTYVVNRNLNASNHCVLRCGFCAFRRFPGEAGAFRISMEALRERAAEAQALGATELCLQAGLDPEARLQGSQLDHASSLLVALREAAPGIHLHGFSPQELIFIAQQDRIPLARVLQTLQEAGLGSVPGTAAEVLSPRVRQLICPEKLSARAWVAVVLQVHQQGLCTTSTLLAGHVETPMERLAHLCTLGALQAHARRQGHGSITEFILLPFVGASAPPTMRARVGRDQPDREEMLLLTAQARLLLGPWIRNHQSSWVKLTLPSAAEALDWGCNDLGGTLMEEHISTMAGAAGGTSQSVGSLQAAAGSRGRPAYQRTTLYGAPAAPATDG